jgi:Ca2+-binding EF-hand superfamily protein
MNSILKSMTVTTLFVGVAAIAAAEPPPFKNIDKNNDGYISREEASSVPDIMKLFASVDANRDGRLSQAEYANAVKELQANAGEQHRG